MSRIWNSLTDESRNTLFCMARAWKERTMQEATEMTIKGYIQALVDLKKIREEDKQDFLLYILNDIVTEDGTFNVFVDYKKEGQA